jgi:hypothetical protein
MALHLAKRRRHLSRGRSHAQPERLDPRRSVPDPKALKIFVDTVICGDIAKLPTSQQSLAAAIRGSMKAKLTVNSVISAIPRLTKNDWKGVNGNTLKDNYYRPPGGARGQAPRTRRYKASLCAQTKNS